MPCPLVCLLKSSQICTIKLSYSYNWKWSKFCPKTGHYQSKVVTCIHFKESTCTVADTANCNGRTIVLYELGLCPWCFLNTLVFIPPLRLPPST